MDQREIEMRRLARQRRRRRRLFRRRLLQLLLLCLAGFLLWTFLPRPKNAPTASSPSPPPSQSAPPSQRPSPSPSDGMAGREDWRLTLVNQWHPLSKEHTIRTVKLTNGLEVDERCYSDLQAMMDACREEGLTPVICSGYRSYEEQEELFQDKVRRLMAEGWSEEDAQAEAGTVVAVPGTSEHQLGLALDIVDMSHQLLDESQENTEVQKWLMEHSWEYGFLLRYPTGKSDVTGIIYEPWHYRYVGKENAELIYASGLCLEEYLAQES